LAAGFTPLALCTETDGSIGQPANRLALYGLKATVGVVSTEGIAPWSAVTDSVGGMAKSAEDLANLFSILERKDFRETLVKNWEGLKVGFVDPHLWEFSPIVCEEDPVFLKQVYDEMNIAAELISRSGAIVKMKVPLTSMKELLLDGKDALEQIWSKCSQSQILAHGRLKVVARDFGRNLEEYLKGYQDKVIISLSELIEFNKAHAERALPNGTE
jgi:amidase